MNPRFRRLREAEIAELISAYVKNGQSKVDTTRVTGISRETVRFHVKRWLRGDYEDIPGMLMPPDGDRPYPAPASRPIPEVEEEQPDYLERGELILKLRRGEYSLDELAEIMKCSKGQALDLLDELADSGVNLHQFAGKYSIAKTPIQGQQRHPDRFEFPSDADGWFKFGLVSDTHLGSKYARLDVLNDLYDIFAGEGITRVYHAGNWIEGVAHFNKFDLLPEAHGLEPQVDLFIRDYPQRPGITTYYIDGDDHEGWFSQREGVEVGRFAEMKAQKTGREDLKYLSYMEAFITLRHARTDAINHMLIQHPGGGSSYSESYVIQKIIESFQGGEKPGVLVCGHYHKMSYNLVRAVHAVQPGCTKDQDIFGRKKRLHYTIGGMVVRMKMDENGAIARFLPEFLQYFHRGYYRDQWSMSGPVKQAPITRKADLYAR